MRRCLQETNSSDNFRYRLFAITECLITADGSEDSSVTPEGFRDYAVPHLLDASEAVPKAPTPPDE